MDWELLEEISSGSFGTVSKVRNKKTKKIAALKIIHPNLNSEEEKRRIKINFISASKISHPNCVKMIEWVETPQSYGFAMEFVDGKPISFLKNLRNKETEFSLSKAIQAIIQVCNGLDELHSLNLVHRDLKPENILITSEEEVKITDFDFLKTSALINTPKGIFIGTIKYASPEQCVDSKKIDGRSDLYSLGVILYELITGKLPFDGKTNTEIILAHIKSPLVFPKELPSEIPNSLKNIIEKLLAKNPKDRFQSARNLIDELKVFLSEREISKINSGQKRLLPPTFVGREEFLYSLENNFHQVTSSRGKAVLILGDSGVGKTKLWNEFCVGLNLFKVNIFETFCVNGSGIYKPLSEIIKQCLTSLKGLENHKKAEILGNNGKILLDLCSEPQDEELLSLLEQQPFTLAKVNDEIRFFETVQTFFTNLSEIVFDKNPIIIFFDDLQWADEKTCNWLNFLFKNIHKLPIYFVGTSRSQFSDSLPFKRILTNFEKVEEYLETIHLKPLDLNSVSALLTSMLGKSEPINEDFAKGVMKRCSGNPLFISEIVRYLLRTEKIKLENGKWILNESSIEELKLPSSIQHILTKQLELLRPEVLKCLQVASIIGKTFSSQQLIDLLEIEENTVLNLLEEARFEGLIKNKVQSSFEFTYDAICESLLVNFSEKKEFHEKVGFYLEKQNSENLEQIFDELAKHFYLAKNYTKAIEYCSLAGDFNNKEFSYLKAEYFYAQVIELAQKTGDKELEIDFLLKRNVLLENLTKLKEQNDSLNKALKLALEINDDLRVGRVSQGIGELQYNQGKFEEAKKNFDKAIKLFEQENSKTDLVNVYQIYFYFYLSKYEQPKAKLVTKKRLEIAKELKDESLIESALLDIYKFADTKEEVKEALSFLNKRKKNAKKENIIDTILTCNDVLGIIFLKTGKIDNSIQISLENLKLSNRFGMRLNATNTLLNLGVCYYINKDYKNAIYYFNKGLEKAKEIEFFLVIHSANINLAQSYFAMGEELKAQSYALEAKKWNSYGLMQDIFENDLLLIQIEFAIGNQIEAFKNLESLLKSAVNDFEYAKIYHTYFNFAEKPSHLEIDREKYRRKALEYFFKINQSSPKFTYQRKIDELLNSSNTDSSISQTTLSLVEALTKWMDPEIIYTEILNFLIRECDADRGQIIYYKENTNYFEMRALSPGLEGEDFDFSRGILQESIRQNKPTLIENAVESTQFKHNVSVYGKIFLSVISVPLKINNEIIGAIYLDRCQVEKGVFKTKNLNNVLTLTKLISSVLWQQEKNKTFQFESKIRRLGMFVGNSVEMQKVYKQIENTSKVKLPVFIYGETGTGKELVAKSIHYISENKNNPFIAINCAALPRGLVESELFGHEKGSFTGAFERQGKFELADNGTLFLDEIAELSLENQAKILRAIEEKQIWRVGGKNPISINTRIITATHRNLKDEISKGTFREDLYHRLNVLKIEIPPLRERVSDILPFPIIF